MSMLSIVSFCSAQLQIEVYVTGSDEFIEKILLDSTEVIISHIDETNGISYLKIDMLYDGDLRTSSHLQILKTAEFNGVRTFNVLNSYNREFKVHVWNDKHLVVFVYDDVTELYSRGLVFV